MQVDLVGGCDNSSRLEVVAHTRKRLGTPLLDEFDLDVGSFLKLCRRHRCLFQRFRVTLYSVVRTNRITPFYGIQFKELARSREDFVKDWHPPPCRISPDRSSGVIARRSSGSSGRDATPTPDERSRPVLEPCEQLPERVVWRGNERWLTPPRAELCPGHVRPQALSDPAAGGVGRGDERRRQGEPPCGLFALETPSAATRSDEVADLMERDEVAHLAADRRDADLESALATPVAVSNADHDSAASTPDTPDAVNRAQVVDVEIERLGLHRASVVRAEEVRRVCARRGMARAHQSGMGMRPSPTVCVVIALAAGLALLIGWYRGFNVRSLELTATAFAVVLAAQTVGLILTGGDVGPRYWPTVGIVALGWVGCLWIGNRARNSRR